MEKEVLKALKGSIKKWDNIVKGTGGDEGTQNCPLCQLDGFCKECPVKLSTGRQCCRRTPYTSWCDHKDKKHDGYWGVVKCSKCIEIAKKELAFLKSLLPKEK